MSLVAAIERGWSWTGLRPVEVIGDNPFGNLIVKDVEGRYWRLCPEQLSCSLIAEDALSFHAVTQGDDFQQDWAMSKLAALAKGSCGLLTPGRRYCLKIPAVLGGTYDQSNIGTISLVELIHVSGELAKQIKDVPDGQEVCLEVR